jgi:hypothetical protein
MISHSKGINGNPQTYMTPSAEVVVIHLYCSCHNQDNQITEYSQADNQTTSIRAVAQPSEE